MAVKNYLAFIIFCFAVEVATSSVLSQTVGSIGEEIVSSRDVQIEAVLEKILFPVVSVEKPEEKSKGKKDTRSKPEKNVVFIVQLKDKNFQSELSSTLLEYVLLKEAESFQVAKSTDEEVKDSVQKVEKFVAGNSYWNSLEVNREELSAAIKRKLTAKKYIKIKTDLMTALVTDQDALNYYERNRIKFGQLPFSSFRENIKTYLSQQQLEERIKTLFEVIKRKYHVRNYLAEGRQLE